jgi:hypothetical protein
MNKRTTKEKELEIVEFVKNNRGMKGFALCSRFHMNYATLIRLLNRNNISLAKAKETRGTRYHSVLTKIEQDWLRENYQTQSKLAIGKKLKISYAKVCREIELVEPKEPNYSQPQPWEKNGFFCVDEFGKLYEP